MCGIRLSNDSIIYGLCTWQMKLKGMDLDEISELLAQPKEYISNILKLLEDNGSLDNIDISSIVPE